MDSGSWGVAVETGRGDAVRPENLDGRLEIVERFERLVDARETQVRHHVERAERTEDGETDLIRVDLRCARLAHRFFDFLREHRQILIRDSGRERTRSTGWQGSERRWTVSHKASSIRAVTLGMGYSWFAEEIIRDELASGQLKPLPLREGARRPIPLFLIYADRDAVGPGLQRLVEILREQIGSCPGAVSA